MDDLVKREDVVEAMARGIAENLQYKVTKSEAKCFAYAALSAIEAQGLAVVPVGPTEAMVKAGCWHMADNQNAPGTMQELMAATFRAMLAASPIAGEGV